MLLLRPDFLRILLVVLIPLVAVLTLANRSLGRENHSHRQSRQRKYILAVLAALLLGFYDGFFGPGMGMFLILFYTLALKYDFVTANANTKVVNLASNVAAVVTFIIHGKVIFAIGIPAAAPASPATCSAPNWSSNGAAASSARYSSWPWFCC